MLHYLLLLDRLQDLDDAFLIVMDIDALKHFAVLATTHFADHLVVVLISVQKTFVIRLL